jgi:hypothetical protein
LRSRAVSDWFFSEQLLQGPDVSLKRAMSILCRTREKEKVSGHHELPGLKVEKEAVKKEALDSASQMGALRQVLPSLCSHAAYI